MLDNYYDRNKAYKFETLFGGTDIGRNPTPNRNRHVVLWFDFSAFNNTLETLEERFEHYCHIELGGTLKRNLDLFPEDTKRQALDQPTFGDKLNELFVHVRDLDIPLYVLIDEYDNVANTVLTQHGDRAYQSFTHDEGFYPSFFATLKAGTEAGGIERLFVTGVSPITMDDATSGFNIGANISLRPDFNEMLGFTEAEVRRLLETYRDHGAFDRDIDATLELMREWYDGYRFARQAGTRVYNTVMVLYFLSESIPNKPLPDELIDHNARIDYGKLRHLLVVNRQAAARQADLNSNFDMLRDVIADGGAKTRINVSFPLERLTERDNFLSLLYYFGLLSIRGADDDLTELGIPNETIRHLMYGFLRDAWQDADMFSIEHHMFILFVGDMARHGDWRPALDYLSEALARQTGIRDFMSGEKVVQAFFMAYFGLSERFLVHSEAELTKDYGDLYLEPHTARYPRTVFGYVIELKYLKQSETGDQVGSVAAALAQAQRQLRRYPGDATLRRRHPAIQHIGLAVVFRGWEMAACEAVTAKG